MSSEGAISNRFRSDLSFLSSYDENVSFCHHPISDMITSFASLPYFTHCFSSIFKRTDELMLPHSDHQPQPQDESDFRVTVRIGIPDYNVGIDDW
jgi:hypothetical protein